MTKKEIAVNAVHALKKEYPDAICSLVYTDPLQLLIATRLAAQCTDARVNMVTPSLFDRFKTAQDFADSTPEEVAEYIKNMLWKRKKIYSYMGGAGKTIFVSDTNWYPIINSKIHEITDQEFEFFSLEARKSRAYIYMFLTDECDVNIMITKNDYSDNKQPLNCRFIEDVFYR